MNSMDEKINSIRETINSSSSTRQKLESQIQILKEQIHTARMTDAHLQCRLDAIDQEKKERFDARKEYDEQKAKLDEQIASIDERKKREANEVEKLRRKSNRTKTDSSE